MPVALAQCSGPLPVESIHELVLDMCGEGGGVIILHVIPIEPLCMGDPYPPHRDALE